MKPFWLYSISAHTFTSPEGVDYSTGIYSGGGIPPTHVSNDVNNCSSCGIVDYGPLPPGTWTMTQLIPQGASTGPNTIVLVPDNATAQFAQSLHRDSSSFRIHGDSIQNPGQASEGCIIAPFDFRVNVLWASPVKTILVVP